MITHIAQFLEKSAAKNPHKIALIDKFSKLNKEKLSYKELNELSNALASKILKLGLKNEGVLILLPKSAICLVSFLGVAKSGNFYTLLDEKSPKERVLKVISILKPRLLITCKSLNLSFKEIKNTLFIEDLPSFKIDKKALQEARNKHIDTNLLYVFFTSGSTGTPKGVSIAHKSVIDYTFWVCDTFKLTARESLANQAPFYFDNSILDIFSSLKAGATLHILPNALFAFPAKILAYLKEYKISMIFWVPSVLIYFANTKALECVNLKHLKKILFCGEIMPNKQLNIWRKSLPKALYANLYGPTEITDVCSFFIVRRKFKDDALLPIGKACKNTELLVFDENLSLIKEEEAFKKGELFVRGTSLSLGYFKDTAKTAAAFIQNPLHNDYLDLLYKTGDIVAYNERGELLCYGRKDGQIKISGHRVELGEIESVTISHKEVKNCACMFEESLICFYEAANELDLKGFLKDKLPAYMLPKSFVRLDKFKLNDNGKIDRKALKELVLKDVK